MSTFPERLRQAREAAGLNKVQLSKLVGVTKQAVGALENGGAKSPTPDNLFSYADALNVNPRWLATGKGSPDPTDIIPVPTAKTERIQKIIDTIEEMSDKDRERIEAVIATYAASSISKKD